MQCLPPHDGKRIVSLGFSVFQVPIGPHVYSLGTGNTKRMAESLHSSLQDLEKGSRGSSVHVASTVSGKSGSSHSPTETMVRNPVPMQYSFHFIF